MNSRSRAVATGRRRRWRALIASAGVLAAGALGVAVLAANGQIRPSGQAAAAAAHHAPRPRRPVAPPVGRIGSYPVASRSILLIDRSRARLGARALPTLVRYPVVPAAAVASGKYSRGPFPLVVFAPGYLQCRSSYSSLLSSWASAGYVVAAVEFPRTHCDDPAPDEADLSNQPADMSLVITRLLAISARPDGVLAGLIDRAKIAVAGHSDGGDTAAAVASNTCCRDRRVIAAMILSGAEWPPLGGHYFPRGTPPIIFIQGSADTWNPPQASAQLYASDTAGVRFYLDLLGANHFTPYEGRRQPEPLVARVTVDFLDRYLAGQASGTSAMAADGNVAGVAVLGSRGRLPG